MKKILLIAEFSSYGGTRTYFKYLLKFYASQKYDVIVALTKNQFDEEVKSLLENNGFRYYLISDRKTYHRKFWFPFGFLFDIFAPLLIVLREKPNLIVISNGTPGNFIGLILFPVRFLYVLHTYPTYKNKMQGVFMNLFLSKRKILLTVSEFAKNKILEFWVDKKNESNVHVIYNSASIPTSFEKNLNNDNSRCRILTLGKLMWYKNPKLWIDVAQKVIQEKHYNQTIEFIWAGDGGLYEDCIKIVEENEMKNVKFIGYNKKVESLYNDSAIYFQPSLIENHSIAVVEAMAHGLPCVTSNVGGLPESVVNGKTGFTCQPDDVESFVSRIVELIDNLTSRTKMGNAGKQRFEMLFSEKKQEKEMVNLYTALFQEENS